MSLKPKSDFWTVGLVPRTATALLEPGALADAASEITWLPDAGSWRYLADPFALKRGDDLHVFVEAYDYRTKHGFIERHEFGPDLVWRGKAVALERPYHLSYPFLIEEGGETFMVPESHKAREIALYRATSFPDAWVKETVLLGDITGAEASLIRHEGRWWMFYTLVGAGARDQRELHVAHAPSLTGPWTMHPQNPVLVDKAGARPGGTPFIGPEGLVVLPVQDCHLTYGGALRFLTFPVLDENHVECRHLPVTLTGGLASAAYPDGLHTFSACGEMTLIDVKRISRSYGRHLVNLKRRLFHKRRF